MMASTMEASPAPRAPASAATEPPPGATVSLETSSTRQAADRSMSGELRGRRYSTTFMSGSKGATESSPSDWRAVETRSRRGTDVDLPCRSR